MSCEQRENGTFTFKKSGYTKVMREVRTMFQALDNYRYDVAVCIYELLKENKVKKNIKETNKFISSLVGKDRYTSYADEYKKAFKLYSITNIYGFEVDEDCLEMALKEIYRNNNNTRLKPRRSAYPKLINKDKSFSKSFKDLIYITLEEETLSLSWSVRQGNRTVDEADNHYITTALFKILNDYEWKIGEGGKTVCVSENFDDDPCTPDMLPHTTRTYEKLSKKQIAARKRMHKKMIECGVYPY